LPELGQVEALTQLGLTREQDLEKGFAGGLKVREQPELLERRRIEVLSFVDDDDRLVPDPVAVNQEVVESDQALSPRCAHLRNAEVLQHVLEDPVEWEARVHDDRHRRVLVKLLEKGSEEGRLACPYIAGQRHEALAFPDGIRELSQRLPMP